MTKYMFFCNQGS